jgi:hypothetical protein
LTNSAKIIDVKQQLIDLFEKENVLAFFDFQLTLDQKETIQGLCKIAEPKEGQSKSNYLSLFFIIDTSEEAKESTIDALIKGIAWGDFKKYMQGIDTVVSIPHVNYGTHHYIKEVELYLSPSQQATRAYLAGALYPAINKALGCRGGDLVFWDEIPFEKKNLEIPQETDRSLIAQLIDYFKRT